MNPLDGYDAFRLAASTVGSIEKAFGVALRSSVYALERALGAFRKLLLLGLLSHRTVPWGSRLILEINGSQRIFSGTLSCRGRLP